MDSLSATSYYEFVVFMKGSQIAGTEIGLNWLGYLIDHTPGPSLMIMPTVEAVKENSRIRIDPLIDECPALRSKVSEPRSRDSGNTMLMKEFPGGFLAMTGANSPISLRSKPIRFLFLDEVSAYPGDAGGEGDPVELAVVRTRNFRNRKIYLCSSPKTKGLCRIEREYDRTDKRQYHVPCPYCGAYQVFLWQGFKWEKHRPETAYYQCGACGERIYEYAKTEMLAKGKWIAQNPKVKKRAGFHLPAFYSPLGFYSWPQMIEDFLRKKDNPPEFKTFVNTVWAETWEERGEAPEWKRIYFRREEYERGKVPMAGLILVAGADVQKDRIEVEIVACGRGKESFSIDYRVLSGDTAARAVWEELDKLMNETFEHESGHHIPIRMCAVDAGYNTQHVYNWVRRYPATRVMAVKGFDSQATILGTARYADYTRDGVRFKRGVKYWPIGVGVIKSELYGYLRLEKGRDDVCYPPGYCHFPEYDEEYFKQLTAEHLFIRAGIKRFEWKKVYERNEALDCRVYARAAATAVGLDRLTDKHWLTLEDELKPIRGRNEIPAMKSPLTRRKARVISNGIETY